MTETTDGPPGACDASCTFREAILAANALPGPDKIHFALGADMTIRPTSPLPTISDAVEIDGTSQPGYVDRPIVEVNGETSPVGPTHGLLLLGDDITLRGMVIHGMSAERQIVIHGSRATIVGSYVGVRRDGITPWIGPFGNIQNAGIVIEASRDTRIGGPNPEDRNVLGGTSYGVLVAGYVGGTGGTLVQGNYIGVGSDGSTPIPIVNMGVSVQPSALNMVIEDNVIGASNYGITIEQAVGAVVRGNLIGLDASGTAPVPNRIVGVGIFGNDITVGDPTGDPNVISGNPIGIQVYSGSANTTIHNNLVGTDSTGLLPVPNTGAGILIAGPSTTVGGGAADTANLIAANGSDGIRIVSGAADTDVSGNVIRDNAGAGVWITGGTGHEVVGNQIVDNGGLGIDLGPAGITANDAGDADGGPNLLQNHPEITLAEFDGVWSRISGSLDSAAGSPFTIDVYATPACDTPLPSGEGARYLGSFDVTTDAMGIASFANKTVDGTLNAGEVATATATDAAGNTSEFSSCRSTAVSLTGTVVSEACDLRQDAAEDADDILQVIEQGRSTAVLCAALPLDITVPGTYGKGFNQSPTLSPGSVPLGTEVRSFLVHADRAYAVTQNGDFMVRRQITLDFTGGTVLGIIVRDGTLNTTDILGAPGTLLPTGLPSRGHEVNVRTGNQWLNPAEGVILSADRQQVRLAMEVGEAMDQVRIITEKDAVLSNFANLRLVDPPPSLLQDAYDTEVCSGTAAPSRQTCKTTGSTPPAQLADDVVVMHEQTARGATLPTALAVDISAPGDYTTLPAPSTIAAGTAVRSVLLHVDRVGAVGALPPDDLRYYTHVFTFTADVLGVIASGSTLDASDYLGASGVLYATGTADRGADFGSAMVLDTDERIVLSADRRTLTLQLSAANRLDEVRVLIADGP